MSGNEYIEEIIYRHLSRETSPLEESELDAWLKESAENRAEYDGIAKIWNETANITFAVDFDKSVAWESLENKINKSKIPVRKKVSLLIRSLRVAAAIILLGLLAELVYYLIRPKSPSQVEVLALQGNQKIQLKDGSVILLRKGSRLLYNADYPVNGRHIELSGEAYFEVQHDENNPFTIRTNKTVIEELGTSFLVKSTDQAEQVFVTKGIVRVSESIDKAKTIILSTGQSVSIIGKQFDKKDITDNNYLAWQSGVLQFDNVPLKKMIIDLNQNFQTDISLSDALAVKSDTIRVNFRFENNSLDQVLDEIHITTGWIVERSGKRIILHE